MGSFPQKGMNIKKDLKPPTRRDQFFFNMDFGRKTQHKLHYFIDFETIHQQLITNGHWLLQQFPSPPCSAIYLPSLKLTFIGPQNEKWMVNEDDRQFPV